MELLEQHLIIWMTHGCRLVLWRIAQRRAVRQQKATLIPNSPQERWFSAFGVDAQALLRPSGQAAWCPRSVGGDFSAGYSPWRHVETREKSLKKNSLKKWMSPRECLKMSCKLFLVSQAGGHWLWVLGRLVQHRGGVSEEVSAINWPRAILGDLAAYNSRIWQGYR